jgi:hypothetical protein
MLKMMENYILDDNNQPIKCSTELWANWMEQHPDRKIIGRTYLTKDIFISTVFLGIDHSFNDSKPVLWETMICGGKYDGEMERYTSFQDAIDGHLMELDKIRSEQDYV